MICSECKEEVRPRGSVKIDLHTFHDKCRDKVFAEHNKEKYPDIFVSGFRGSVKRRPKNKG